MRRILIVLSCMLLVGAFTANAQDMTTARLERSEVRFLEGMSDHHQMALDMANDCLAKAQTPSVVELCQAVITAQTPEIEQMQAWLLEWYNIEYAVMSMSPTAATEPSGASDDPMSAMMGHMGHMSDMMSGMADHMGHMDQMGDMMSRMGDMMSQMSTMMSQMGDMMGMMAGMGATDPAAGTDHSSHGSTDTSTDHSNHGSTDTSTDHSGHTAAGPHSDPAMMMGMFAGFNRLEGVEYEIAWLESMIDHHNDAIHMSERLLARGVVHEEVGALAQAIIDAQTAEIELMETMIAELAQ